ncbi:hypothetical protein [Agrobacterium tumefaciens]|uniref:hypothetical protein n=1 Tax=Agrobacterium tumefaciens TaxID=358 RepID=UPI0021D1E964|nr:hypothetical protein [Agrobacterium tumefaciens]
MQQNSTAGRTIKAANTETVSTYHPIIIPLKGSFAAMIFRRSRGPKTHDVQKG